MAATWKPTVRARFGGVYVDLDTVLLSEASIRGPEGLLARRSIRGELQLSGAFAKVSRGDKFLDRLFDEWNASFPSFLTETGTPVSKIKDPARYITGAHLDDYMGAQLLTRTCNRFF